MDRFAFRNMESIKAPAKNTRIFTRHHVQRFVQLPWNGERNLINKSPAVGQELFIR